jgi:protein SCO1
MREADVDERLGAFVPKDIVLRSESGEPVTTGELVGGDLPTVLVLAYYRCPMLCPLVVDGAAKGLSAAGYVAGRDYRLVTVSIDPSDRPVDAAKRRDVLLAKIGSEQSPGVRFAVGDPAATKAVADAVGFRYAYDARTDQYAHAAVLTVLAPGGRISRYLYGVEPPVRDLRLAIVEAGEGKVGSIVDRVLVTCYRYDPSARRYGPYIEGFFKLGALVVLGVVGTGLGFLWKNERRKARAGKPSGGSVDE